MIGGGVRVEALGAHAPQTKDYFAILMYIHNTNLHAFVILMYIHNNYVPIPSEDLPSRKLYVH